MESDLDVWTPVLQVHSEYLSERYILSRLGETCRCSNDYLIIFGITDFSTREKAWEMRETPFGETGFRAVGLWLAAQMTQTIGHRSVFGVFAHHEPVF